MSGGARRHLDAPDVDLPGERAEPAAPRRLGFRVVGIRERIGRLHGIWRDTVLVEEEVVVSMTKVEAVVIRERIETVIDAVEEQTGHVGVTVVEAVGHGRERGITHEYRGRVFESRFLPKALLVFLVEDESAADGSSTRSPTRRAAATSRGDGLVWTTPGRERHAQPHGQAPGGGRSQ